MFSSKKQSYKKLEKKIKQWNFNGRTSVKALSCSLRDENGPNALYRF